MWDDVQKSPYAYKDQIWIGYDDVRSVKIKTEYAVEKKLAGAMVWTVDFEDANNNCGQGVYPLLSAINEVFKVNQNPASIQMTGYLSGNRICPTECWPIGWRERCDPETNTCSKPTNNTFYNQLTINQLDTACLVFESSNSTSHHHHDSINTLSHTLSPVNHATKQTSQVDAGRSEFGM